MGVRADAANPERGRVILAVLVLALLCGAAGWLLLRAPAPERNPGRPAPAHKLLVIGWDGATFDMLDPLLAAGRLPHVAELLARGSSALLESTRVPISSAAWVGAVTGKGPGDNGVYSFFEPIEASYDVELIDSHSNRATPLWRILDGHGLRSLVFNVPVTYPPEAIEGVLVGCMLAPFEADYAHPPGLAAALRARGFAPDLGAWRERQEVTFERVEEQLAIKRDILLELLHEEAWDFAMIVFKDLDVWCHRAYDGRTDTSVAEHYELLDGVLGELLAQVGADVDVILMSDHGFAAYEQSFFVQRWLLEQGYAQASAAELERTPRTRNLAERRALEHQRLLAGLDLERSVAFAGVCEGNYGGVRLNVRGREPGGALAPERVEATLEELAMRLRAWRAPGRAAPVVVDVRRGPELYPGPYSGRLPDLIFELDPGICARSEPSAVVLARHAVLPDHALHGVFVAAGPSFSSRAERGAVSIFDLAPTALAALGLPVYTEMTGTVRAELFRRAPTPVRLREADDPLVRPRAAPKKSGFSGAEAEEVRSRLAETGYGG